MAGEAGGKEQPVDGGGPDDWVVVGGHVVCPHIRAGNARVWHVGEPIAEFHDVLLDRGVVGAVDVLVRVDVFRRLVVGVADEEFPVRLAADVLQAGEIGQNRYLRGRDSLVDQDQLCALRFHVEVDAHTGSEPRCPRAGGEDDVVGMHLRSVLQCDAVDRVGIVLQQRDHRGALADLDPHLPRGRGERHARHVRLAAPTEWLVGEQCEVVEMQSRPEFGHLVVCDEFGCDS